ncbi:MAG: TRAP transporter small permease [Candidatus Puniceispirillaceae bacterium]
MTVFISLRQKTETLSAAFALAGGVMLIALAILTILSVFGRTINAYGFGPIQGDFELVENGTAFVVFCSLPYCQMRFGHVSIDILARRFPHVISKFIAVLSQAGMAVIAFIITRQLYLGMVDKYQWGETSFILQLPVWWGYAASLPASILWFATCMIATIGVLTNLMSEEGVG